MRYYSVDTHKKYCEYKVINERGVISEQVRIPNEPKVFARIMDHSGKETKRLWKLCTIGIISMTC